MKMIYRIKCQTGYAILGEDPPKMDVNATYHVIGQTVHYPHCYVVARCDGEEYCGNKTWIVHTDALEPI